MIRLLALLLLAGCADYNELSMKGDASGDADTARKDPDDSGNETDTAGDQHPAWYVVRADLTVANGRPTAEGAVVAIDVVDEDEQRVNCVVELPTQEIVASAVDSADATIVWWELPVAPAEAPCATLPSTLVLGVGPMHADVRARLGAVGNDDIADSLYGAYLVLGAEVAAFGYAGTATDLLGDDTAVVPPPDGLYRLSPLYLVPLPE